MQRTRTVELLLGKQLAVVRTGRVASGDKVRVYEDGTGWNASEGRSATDAEVREASS